MTSNLLSSILPQLVTLLQEPDSSPAQFADAYKLISDQLLPHVATEPRSVDLSVYLWFVGAEGVNRGIGPFSDFIRSYTSTQSYLRSGTYPDESLQNLASNKIASAVIRGIIESDGEVPGLFDIGNSDVTGAANTIFSGDKAGWSGNILFSLLGESSFLTSNLLSESDDTYDIIAALHSFYDALALPETGQDLSIAFQMLSVMLLGNTSATLGGMGDVVIQTAAFLNTAYGLPAYPGQARVIAGVNVLDDTIDLTAGYEIVNAGGGNDTINAGLAAAAGDIIDGGAGYDTVSYDLSSALSDEHVDVHLGAPQLIQSEVSYTGYVSRSGVLSSDYLFDIESIAGTKNDDRFTVERVPLFLSAISVDGKAGVDTLDVSDVGTSPSRSTTLGSIDLGGRYVGFSGFENINLLGDVADRVALNDWNLGSGVDLPVVDMGANGSVMVDGRLLTDGIDVSALSESGGIADLRISSAQSFQILSGETFRFRNAESFVGTCNLRW